MYLYESHLGSLYTTDHEMDFTDLYCEQCGDSDRLVGEFNSAIDVLIYMANDIALNGSGGWCLEHVIEILYEAFEDCPDYKMAKQIVIDNKTNSNDLE